MFKNIFIAFVLIVSFLLAPVYANAQQPNALQPKALKTDTGDLLGTTLNKAGLEYGSAFQFGQVIGNIVSVVLSLIGVIILALAVYAGFLWMTAQGNADKVKKAQSIFAQVVVGALVIATSALTVGVIAPATNVSVLGWNFTQGFLDTVGLAQGGASEGAGSELGRILGQILRVVFGLVGTIATALYIYAGFVWFRSAGNDDDVKKARRILAQTTIALIVIIGAFSIVGYFLLRFSAATGTVVQ